MQCYVFHDSFGEVVSSGKKSNKKQSKFNQSSTLPYLNSVILSQKMRQVDPENTAFETLPVMLSPSICRPVPCASSINPNALCQYLASLKLLMPAATHAKGLGNGWSERKRLHHVRIVPWNMGGITSGVSWHMEYRCLFKNITHYEYVHIKKKNKM